MKPGWFIAAAVACCVQLLGERPAYAQQDGDDDAGTLVVSPFDAPFAQAQLQYSRVRAARSTTESQIQQLFRKRGIHYPASEMYLRVFKRERTLELWVRSARQKQFQLVKAYRVCALAGALGPKRRAGDQQVPEGFYHIDVFNPASEYHLSMRVDYPNERDRLVNGRERDLGGDIFIHGGCRSEGCLAITDESIREVYLVALAARAAGQTRIPVHIYPMRFGASWDTRSARRLVHADPAVVKFWQTLKPAYYYFERHHRIPAVSIDARGNYRLAESAFAVR